MMDFDFLLDYRATDSEAEVFWDMPLDADLSCRYLCLINGSLYKEITKTHISLTDLTPDTALDVEIRIIYPEGHVNGSEPVCLGRITVRTGKVLSLIHI